LKEKTRISKKKKEGIGNKAKKLKKKRGERERNMISLE